MSFTLKVIGAMPGILLLGCLTGLFSWFFKRMMKMLRNMKDCVSIVTEDDHELEP